MNKKKLNNQNLWCIASVVFVVLLIVFTTIWNAGLDVTKWKEKQFISNLLINCAICIFGLFSSISLADNHYRTKENGLFVTVYNNFYKAKEKIEKYLDKFPYWIRRLHKKESQDKCIRYLKDDNGITQAVLILKYLDRQEVVKLVNPFEKNIDGKKLYFKALSQNQVDAIIKVLDGKIKVKFLHDTYFLNAYLKNDNKSMYEKATEEEKGRNKKSFFLIVSKVIITMLIGTIFAGLIVEGLNGASAGTILINAFGRLSVLASAMYSGYNIGNILVKYDSNFIDYKTNILQTFYLEVVENHTVVCLTEEQEAELEYNEFKEKNNE